MEAPGRGNLGGMTESQEQARRAVREMGQELSRTLEQAGKLFRQATDDLGGWVGKAPDPFGLRREASASPAERIRALGALRTEGLITEAEFQAKKTEILAQF